MMRPLRVATGALAVVLLGVSAAVPQPDTVLSGLGIDLWPDYDRPGVLVIYRATIAITRDGARRSFAFTWSGDFEVRDFSISLQQPHLAQNFTTVPEATGAAASVDGLMYHTLSRAGVKMGEAVEVQASYEKASDRLSVETIAPVVAPTPAPATGNAAASGSRTVLIVLAALFVSAAAVVVGLMVRTRQQAGSAPRSTPPPRTARSGLSGGKATRFCTQCGAGVDGGDRFCQRCGAALKA